MHPTPTLARVAEVFGQVPSKTDRAHYRANPFAPMFDTRAATRRLGWRARHDLRSMVLNTPPKPF